MTGAPCEQRRQTVSPARFVVPCRRIGGAGAQGTTVPHRSATLHTVRPREPVGPPVLRAVRSPAAEPVLLVRIRERTRREVLWRLWRRAHHVDLGRRPARFSPLLHPPSSPLED